MVKGIDVSNTETSAYCAPNSVLDGQNAVAARPGTFFGSTTNLF